MSDFVYVPKSCSAREDEIGALSALFAAFGRVREFSSRILKPVGAPITHETQVETFTSDAIHDWFGFNVQPHGLITLTNRDGRTWSALVDVRTGPNKLKINRINKCLGLASANGIDAVITISNEVSDPPAKHPTRQLRVRSNARIRVYHLPWADLISTALRVGAYKRVIASQHGWMLGELARYLNHPDVGAMTINDMGSAWTRVIRTARTSTRRQRSEDVSTILERWKHTLRYAAVAITAETGRSIALGRPGGSPRSEDLADRLERYGTLAETLRGQRDAGDIEVVIDLKTGMLDATTLVNASEYRTAPGRVNWLLKQLTNAPDSTIIESWGQRMRRPSAVTSLGAARVDKAALFNTAVSEPVRFRITTRSQISLARCATPDEAGFVEAVTSTLREHYACVVQNSRLRRANNEYRTPVPLSRTQTFRDGKSTRDPGTAGAEETQPLKLRSRLVEAERRALTALYHCTGGDEWLKNDNWLSDGPVADWYGVTARDNRVVSLALSENRLSGKLPPEMRALEHLEHLALGYNRFKGRFPTAICTLSRLKHLSLAGNFFSGDIPWEICHLDDLMRLELQDNKFEDIPTGLKSLEYLDISANCADGEIPSDLGELQRLKYLNLQYNKLSGAIPSELGNLKNLEYLNLRHNELSGTIPSELGNLKDLTHLELAANCLEGELPAELANLKRLNYLSLFENELTGPMPKGLLVK